MLKEEPRVCADPAHSGLAPLPPLEDVPSSALVQHNDDIVTIVEDIDGIRVVEDSYDLRVPLDGEKPLTVPSPLRQTDEFGAEPCRSDWLDTTSETSYDSSNTALYGQDVYCSEDVKKFARAAGIHLSAAVKKRGRRGRGGAMINEDAVVLYWASRRLQLVINVELRAIYPLLAGIHWDKPRERLVGVLFPAGMWSLPGRMRKAEQVGELLARLIVTDYNIESVQGKPTLVRRTVVRPHDEVVPGLRLARTIEGVVGPSEDQAH
jgi:hypothetical protein